MSNVRTRSVRLRCTIVFSLLFALVLLLNGSLLVVLKYQEFKNRITLRAQTYTALAVRPICDAYDAYYNSGYFKFRELMNNLIAHEPDITRILLLDLEGNILFNSFDLKDSQFIPGGNQPERIREPYYLKAANSLQTTDRYTVDAEGHTVLEIVSPYIKAWGHHNHSVIMTFSYASAYRQIRNWMYAIGSLTLIGILLASWVIWILAGRVIRAESVE